MSQPSKRVINLKAENGGVYISGTEAVTPPAGSQFPYFEAILCLQAAVANLTASNITGDSIAAVQIPAGAIIYGKFQSITLASGAVIAYLGC